MRIESFSSMAGSAAASDGGFEEWSRGNCLYKCEACERPGKDKFVNSDIKFLVISKPLGFTQYLLNCILLHGMVPSLIHNGGVERLQQFIHGNIFKPNFLNFHD